MPFVPACAFRMVAALLLEKLRVALFADNDLLHQVVVVVEVLQHLLAGQPLSACTGAVAFL